MFVTNAKASGERLKISPLLTIAALEIKISTLPYLAITVLAASSN